MNEIEKRHAVFKQEFRANQVDDEKVLEGYFIRFNEEIDLLPNYREQVAPEAVTGILNEDIRCLFDHDTSYVLGRTTNDTLQLTVDERGVYGRVFINEDDPQALSVYAKVKRGDISGCSFGFYVNEQDEEWDDDQLHVTLTDVDVFEVSVVTFPAYATTDVKARNQDVRDAKKNMFEARKRKLKERLNGIKAITVNEENS